MCENFFRFRGGLGTGVLGGENGSRRGKKGKSRGLLGGWRTCGQDTERTHGKGRRGARGHEGGDRETPVTSTSVVALGSQPEGDMGSHQEANPGSPQLAVGEQKWGTDQEQRELLKSLVPAPLPQPVPCGPLGRVVNTPALSEVGPGPCPLLPGSWVGPGLTSWRAEGAGLQWPTQRGPREGLRRKQGPSFLDTSLGLDVKWREGAWGPFPLPGVKHLLLVRIRLAFIYHHCMPTLSSLCHPHDDLL